MNSCRSGRRWSLIVLAAMLVMASCKSTATVELMDAATTAPTAGSVDSTPAPDPPATDPPAPDPPATDPPATSEPTPAATQTATDARFELQGEIPLDTSQVNGLIDFIEQETGRPFLRPPVIVAQSAEAFVEGLSESLGDFRAEAETTVRVLQALGLTGRGVNEVTAAFEALLLSPEGVLGYYDPATDELYVPIAATGEDAFRSLLVHELTHSLDGQYVDLTVLDDLVELGEQSGNFEPVAALQAVIEGRASSVQNKWVAANGVVPETPDGPDALADVPPAMVLSLGLPYVFGEQFINFKGGAAATWDALENPPRSTEEFMVPGTSHDETIIDVATPTADGPVLDEVVYGAVDIFVWLLGETLEPDAALVFSVYGAIDGWAGGRAVLWGDDTASCVRIAIAGDTETDLLELQQVTEIWAANDSSSRSVTLDGDLVVVTGCAPYLP